MVVVVVVVVVVVKTKQVTNGDDVANKNVESVMKKSEVKGAAAMEERRRAQSTENEVGEILMTIIQEASHHWRRVITRIGDDITSASRDMVIVMANIVRKESMKEMAMRIGSENTEIIDVQPRKRLKGKGRNTLSFK